MCQRWWAASPPKLGQAKKGVNTYGTLFDGGNGTPVFDATPQ